MMAQGSILLVTIFHTLTLIEEDVDRDRSEWTSTCFANLQIEGKSSRIMHVSLSKLPASCKLGVPDVLATCLRCWLETPKLCVLGVCVAFVIKQNVMRV